MAVRAAQALRTASTDLGAQLIVVSQSESASLASSVELVGAEFVSAPPGSSRAQMCDLGMSRAQGSIVVLRDVESVGDARWLDAYRRIVPKRAGSVAESVVMESMVTTRAEVADAGPGYSLRESRVTISGVEIAAAL